MASEKLRPLAAKLCKRVVSLRETGRGKPISEKERVEIEGACRSMQAARDLIRSLFFCADETVKDKNETPSQKTDEVLEIASQIMHQLVHNAVQDILHKSIAGNYGALEAKITPPRPKIKTTVPGTNTSHIQ